MLSFLGCICSLLWAKGLGKGGGGLAICRAKKSEKIGRA